MLRGDDVAELQSRLNSIGFEAGRADGVFGPDTARALSEFQRNAGVAIDGVYGPETAAALSSLGAKAEPTAAGPPVEHLRTPQTLSTRRVMIDPRGQLDKGAETPSTKSGLTEARASYALAEELALQLREHGAIPAISRGPGEDPSGEERAAVANDLPADAVISIGFGWNDDAAAAGTCSYYFSDANRESEAGRRLAALCQNELVGALGTVDCRSHGKSWPILRRTRAPSVVIEPVFLSNPKEAEIVESADGVRQIAAALARSLDRYFSPEDPVS